MYAIPPAATHAGHRADGWDVEKWLKAVRVKVTAKGDRGHIRLEDGETGELFAACPLPRDAPVSTAGEPVLDSSRYFVLRVEDAAFSFLPGQVRAAVAPSCSLLGTRSHHVRGGTVARSGLTSTSPVLTT